MAVAFRRRSYLPSRVVGQIAPAAWAKGHVGAGADADADADIVALDPERITDQASFPKPTRPSIGVEHLIVAGEFVIHVNGHLEVPAGGQLNVPTRC